MEPYRGSGRIYDDAGLRMRTTTGSVLLFQAAAEYSTGVDDIHLIGVLAWLMCRGMTKNKQVCTGYFIHYPILSCAHSLTIPDNLFCIDGLVNAYSLCG